MKALLLSCASIAAAALAGGCSGGGGGPATPFDPFGTEPAGATATEPATGQGGTAPGGGSTAQACARVCARIQSACPEADGASCASDCAATETTFPGCQAEFRAVLACITTAPLACQQGSISVPACDNASLVFSNCIGSQPAGDGGGGTAPPR